MTKYKSVKMLRVSPVVKRVWFFSFLLVVLFISILFLPWQQTIKGEGVLIAYQPEERPYYVYSTISGFIDKYYVKENQFVKKGEPLFKMVDLDRKYIDRLKIIKEKTEAQYKNTLLAMQVLKDKEKNLEESLEIGLKMYNRKITKIENKIEALRAKQKALEKNLEITKINFNRIKTLYKEKIESKRKLELEENKLAKAIADLENLKIELKIERQNLDIVKKEKEKFLREIKSKILTVKKDLITARNKLNSYKKEIEKFSADLSRFKTSTITALKDGYVVRILKNDKNQFIKKGEAILLFSPVVKERAILFKVRAIDMPLIKENLPVRIQFEGWPALQIPGWPTIRFGTFSGYIKKVDPVSHEEGVYYAFVVENQKEKWPSPDVLKLGTRATVWVRLSIVPIWYEIWRNVNAFPPNMINPPKEPLKPSGGK